MKNHTDVLIFHTAFCAEASQKSLDATTEIAYANFCCAIPTLRFGMEIVMKYLKQFGIIICISLIGEILNNVLPLPIPASVYGFVILFVCLMTGVVKLDAVKDTGKFLIEIMPIMFIPAAAGLIESFGILKPILVEISVILVVTTIIVMVVAGRITQFVLRKGGATNEGNVD